MVSTSYWRIGSGKRPYHGIYSELYVFHWLTFFHRFFSHNSYSLILSILFLKCFNFNFFLFLADKVKNAGNITLLALMLLAIYNHWMVNDAFERIGSALVFTFMLTGRLVVWYQISRREAKLNAATQAQANGLKQD